MDNIAQMITSIKNAGLVGKKEIEIPFSKFKCSILEILKSEGFVADFSAQEKIIKVKLAYKGKILLINEIKRVSKPGQRIYRKAKELPFSKRGLGIYLVSTSAGVMTDRAARKKGVGGELLCEIY